MQQAKLIYGCGADSYYATRMEVPDPYLWYQDGAGKTHVVFSPLEVDRGHKQAKVDCVHAVTTIAEHLAKEGKTATLVNQVLWLLQQNPAKEVLTPADFPFGLAKALLEAGVPLSPAQGAFFPERGIKTAQEVALIRQAQALNEEAFKRAFAILAEASIGAEGALVWQNQTLTAEILRGQMNAVIAAGGGMPSELIIACGPQGADPHERGHGPLKAHEFIIIDSWPRGPHGNFYYGDLTRTVLKGRPTEKQLHLYNTVKEAQQMAIDMLKPGILGSDVFTVVDGHFQSQGYTTGLDAQGSNIGFFHGVGHSVGLEVHDKGLGITKGRKDLPHTMTPLPTGLVVTVEPGLYYPNLGGVRIEDIVHITPSGVENLTALEKFLVID